MPHHPGLLFFTEGVIRAIDAMTRRHTNVPLWLLGVASIEVRLQPLWDSLALRMVLERVVLRVKAAGEGVEVAEAPINFDPKLQVCLLAVCLPPLLLVQGCSHE